jgi:hypothetical protein
MVRKDNELPTARLTGDEQELSCFRNTNQAVGWGVENYFTLGSQHSFTHNGLSSVIHEDRSLKFLYVFCSA